MDLTPGPEGPRRESWLPVADQASLFLEEREMEIVGISTKMLAEIQAKARDEGYRAGREDAARDIGLTCQENADSVTLVELDQVHLHECLRERDHRSRVHRCNCGMEWWRDQESINLGRSSGSDPKDTSSGTEVER